MSKKKIDKRHSAIPPVAEVKKVSPVRKDALESATSAVRVEMPASEIAPARVGVESPAHKATATEAPAAETKSAERLAVTAVTAVTAPPADHSALFAALRGGDADSAREAATALGQTGDKSAVGALVEVLTNVDGYYHGVVRAAAAASLGQLGDVKAVECLIGAIQDPMAEASAEAVRSLAILGDARAVAPLIETVRNAGGFFLPIVRRAAVLALAKLGGAEAIAELKAVAANDWEDAVLRQDAVDGLASH
jgi:HEAT repeat protein